MLLSRNSQVRHFEPTSYYKLLAQAGWQAVDINETCVPSRFYQCGDEQLQYVTNVVKTITDAGLVVGQCHAPMAECYEGKSDEEIEARIVSVINCTRIAAKAGIPCTIVHPFIYSWGGDPQPEKTFELNVSYLKRVCAVADNTLVCLENMPGCNGFIKSGEDMKKMGEAVGNDLMFCLDTGHAFSNKLKTSEFFSQVGDKIKTLHVHDSLQGMDKHLLPYLGQGDWADFKEAIKNYNYSGTLNSETSFAVKCPDELLLTLETTECAVFRSLL